jgi:rRNA maturation endonuclease Nob1
MVLDPHIAIFGVLTLVVAYLMMIAGVQKNALEWRRRRRTCPSCGRDIEARVCRACGGN